MKAGHGDVDLAPDIDQAVARPAGRDLLTGRPH